MRGRRWVALAVAASLTAAACSGGGDDSSDEGGDPTAPASTVADTEPAATVTDATTAVDAFVATLPPAEIDADLRARVVEVLEGADVVIVEDASPNPQQFEVITSQVDAMVAEAAAGGGIPGPELDAASVGSDVMPPSALLAAYVVAGDTPGAELSRELLPLEGVADPTLVAFPQAIITMFVAESISTALDELGESPVGVTPEYVAESDGEPEGLMSPRRGPTMPGQVGAICSNVVSWVEGILTWIFDKARIVTTSGGLVGLLASIWNTAVSFAQTAVQDAIDNLAAPVINAVRSALTSLGAVAAVVNLFVQWQADVVAEPATVRYGLDQPGEEGTFTARPVGLPELPPSLKDCVTVLEVPDPSDVSGFPVSWETTNMPEFAERTGSTDELSDEEEATLDFRANTEDDDRGEEITVTASATVTIERQDIAEAEDRAREAMLAWIPEVPVLTEFARDLLRTMTQPVLDQLRGFMDAKGSGTVSIIRHAPCEVEAPELWDGTWSGPLTYDFVGIVQDIAVSFTGNGNLTMTIANGVVTGGEWMLTASAAPGTQITTGTTTVFVNSLVASGTGTVEGTATAPVLQGAGTVTGSFTASDPTIGQIELPPVEQADQFLPQTMTLRDVTCDEATGEFIPGWNTFADSSGLGVQWTGTAEWDGTWSG